MTYSSVLHMCLSVPAWPLGGLFVTPVLIHPHSLVIHLILSQIFMESVIALGTLLHALAFWTSNVVGKTRAQVILSSLYMDGFAYYVVFPSV